MNHKLKWLRDQILKASADKQAWNVLLDSYGFEALSHISRYGVLLLTPDFAAQDLVASLFGWFRSSSCEPVAAACHCLRPAEITLLYAGRITHRNRKGRMHSAWLSPRLYEMGTSILIILRSTDGAPPLQERISVAKGISRYGEHTEEQLRGLSKIADRCFSLIHSPDNYEGFFHLTELVIGTEATKTSLDLDREPLAEKELAALIPKADLANEPHPFDLIFRLLQQGVALLTSDPRAGIPRPLLRRVFERVAAERERLRRIVANQQLEEETWRALSKLHPELTSLTEHQFGAGNQIACWDKLKFYNASLELCRVMQQMCVRESFNTLLSHDIIDTFRRNQMQLEKWDVQRLHVLAAFHGVDSDADASLKPQADAQ
jgi:hypothetical protein